MSKRFTKKDNQEKTFDIQIQTRGRKGFLSIDGLDSVNLKLNEYLQKYEGKTYHSANMEEAEDNFKNLKGIEKSLTSKLKSVKKYYLEPMEKIEEDFKELIVKVKNSYEPIAEFLDNIALEERGTKKQEIYEYFKLKSIGLGEYADFLWLSPAFFDETWANPSTSITQYRKSVDEKIFLAERDIESIKRVGGIYTVPLIVKYLECLDINTVSTYKEHLNAIAEIETVIEETKDVDKVIGKKVVEIEGINSDIRFIENQVQLLGMKNKVIMDDTPKGFKELLHPTFDSFVCFDIETSGTFGAKYNDGSPEITEIGAVKVVNGVVVDKFDLLANPGRKITPDIEKLTHITNEMVKDAPSVDFVIKAFADFVGDMKLVGHNIKSSDLRYIGLAARRAGVRMENEYFDTYLYAKQFKENMGWESLKLEYLSKYYGFEQLEAHRAWCDAQVNVDVYFKLQGMV